MLQILSTTKRSPRPIDDDMLRRLWPTLLTDKEIAYLLGHGRGAIRRRAGRLGLPPRAFARRQRQSSGQGPVVDYYAKAYPGIADRIRRGYSAERIAELEGCEVWVAKLIKIAGRF